jgi:hypothetical protein
VDTRGRASAYPSMSDPSPGPEAGKLGSLLVIDQRTLAEEQFLIDLLESEGRLLEAGRAVARVIVDRTNAVMGIDTAPPAE